MNKQWSDLNKQMQLLIKKSATFDEGVDVLIKLREVLMEYISELKESLDYEDYFKMPFIKQDGFHNKNIAYSLWHIARIEDIVVHTLIKEDDEIFFKGDFKAKINSSFITTGNELVELKIFEFTKDFNINELFKYVKEVYENTNLFLKDLKFSDLKKTITVKARQDLENLHVVNENASSSWLIDYWCNKDVLGLIKMPLSRHIIMHVEAINRIKTKLKPNE